MRVLVHVGMPKTGSSAIQEYLTRSRDELADGRVAYPDLEHPGHWRLAAALSPARGKFHHARRRLEAGEAEQALDAATQVISESLSSLGAKTDAVILSHEGLSIAGVAKRLSSFLRKNTPESATTRLVAYVRHPVALYTSDIQQALKAETGKAFLPDQWRSHHVQRAERILPIIGDRLHLRAFAPPHRPGWDAVDDFRRFAGSFLEKELPEVRETISVNTSLSAQACAGLEALRDTDFNLVKQREIRRSIRQFDAGYASKIKLALPAEWRDDVAAANAEGWNKLVSRLDCDEADREGLRIEPRPIARRYRDEDVKEWLLAGLDADWLTGYSASIDARGFDAAVLAWVYRLRDRASTPA